MADEEDDEAYRARMKKMREMATKHKGNVRAIQAKAASVTSSAAAAVAAAEQEDEESEDFKKAKERHETLTAAAAAKPKEILAKVQADLRADIGVAPPGMDVDSPPPTTSAMGPRRQTAGSIHSATSIPTPMHARPQVARAPSVTSPPPGLTGLAVNKPFAGSAAPPKPPPPPSSAVMAMHKRLSTAPIVVDPAFAAMLSAPPAKPVAADALKAALSNATSPRTTPETSPRASVIVEDVVAPPQESTSTTSVSPRASLVAALPVAPSPEPEPVAPEPEVAAPLLAAAPLTSIREATSSPSVSPTNSTIRTSTPLFPDELVEKTRSALEEKRASLTLAASSPAPSPTHSALAAKVRRSSLPSEGGESKRASWDRRTSIEQVVAPVFVPPPVAAAPAVAPAPEEAGDAASAARLELLGVVTWRSPMDTLAWIVFLALFAGLSYLYSVVFVVGALSASRLVLRKLLKITRLSSLPLPVHVTVGSFAVLGEGLRLLKLDRLQWFAEAFRYASVLSILMLMLIVLLGLLGVSVGGLLLVGAAAVLVVPPAYLRWPASFARVSPRLSEKLDQALFF